jgi:large subunit ribosomal protein L24
MSRAKRRIMKGDRVKIIRGNFRDMEGSVLEVLQDENRVRVEGVNLRKRHTRPTQANPDGGIISMVAPIHISNVMLIDASGEKASRVRTRVEKDGTKERVAVKTGNPIAKPK